MDTRTFDAAGNLIGKAQLRLQLGSCSQSYGYDERDRLVTAQVSSAGPALIVDYDYNGRSERVWRTDFDGKPTLYAYDEAGRLLGEYNNTGGLISEVIWLDDLPVGVRRAGTVYPIEPDHLGSPRTIHKGLKCANSLDEECCPEKTDYVQRMNNFIYSRSCNAFTSP